MRTSRRVLRGAKKNMSNSATSSESRCRCSVLARLLIAALASSLVGGGCTQPAQSAPELALPPAFDFYLLALTLGPAFCAEGHAGMRECRGLDARGFERAPLTLHGLWPERRVPDTYPRDCNGPALWLEPAVRVRMQRLMPGAASALDRYEWRRHGTCSGRPANEYFSDALDLVERVDAALGPAVLAAAGTRVSAAQLRAGANARSAGLGAQLVFVCGNPRSAAAQMRQRPVLDEVRLCASRAASGRVSAPLDCASVGRTDQGCGSSFWIDAP